jgi:hypothetical protein
MASAPLLLHKNDFSRKIFDSGALPEHAIGRWNYLNNLLPPAY